MTKDETCEILPVTLLVTLPVTLPVLTPKAKDMTSRDVTPNKKRAVTIRDVAKAANVSVSTVSRVLNGKVDVAADTQSRVLAVIDELSYTSNLAARSMRSHKKNLIGLVLPDIGSPYSIEIMKGINRAIAETDFDLLVFTTGDAMKTNTIAHEQQYVSLLSNSITDGVLIAASAATKFTAHTPIVVVDPHALNPDYPCVQGTNFEGAKQVMHYLLELGHRRIGFITGRKESHSAARRNEAYRISLAEAGIAVDESLIAHGDYTTKTAVSAARQLLTQPEPPTAIFAANDQSAIGVYQAAEELGFSIPEDLSVVGFDNISEAHYLGLTTVDQFLSDMGYTAVHMLISLIDNEPLDVKIYKMPAELIIRKSCRRI